MILTSLEKIREYTAKGWWGEKTVDDYLLSLVASSPTKAAVVDSLNKAALCATENYTLTYEQLQQKINTMAAILQANGIVKDDIVALQLPNIAELVISYFAITRIGAIASPLPVQYREHECLQLLASLKAKAVITLKEISTREHAAMYTQLQNDLPALQHIFVFDEAIEDTLLIDLQNTIELPVSSGNISANDIFTICWTSGTEGKPRGVPRSHNEWLISAYASVDAAKLTSNDRILLTFPLVNMAGIGGVLVPWLLTGGTLVLHHPFDFPTFLAQLGKEQITYTLVPPSLLTTIIKNEDVLANTDVTSLRAIGTGSAPITSWLIHSWKELHNVDLINYFGSNEGATFLSDIEDVPAPQLRSLYLPRFGPDYLTWHNRVGAMVKSKLIHLETGEEISEPNQPGELLISGPGVFAGYWDHAEANNWSFDEDGYFRTGDLFEIIREAGEDRYYKVVGRLKDLIVRSGMKISPLEIEEFIQQHPAVLEAAVIPYPHKVHGEISCACVVLREGESITLDELVNMLKEHKIASFKLPEKLMTLNTLPRNAVGKVLKSTLSEMAKEQHINA